MVDERCFYRESNRDPTLYNYILQEVSLLLGVYWIIDAHVVLDSEFSVVWWSRKQDQPTKKVNLSWLIKLCCILASGVYPHINCSGNGNYVQVLMVF